MRVYAAAIPSSVYTIVRGVRVPRSGVDYVVDGGSGCWVWRRKVTAKGYGIVEVGGGRAEHAHRWVWRHVRGELGSADLHHVCRNRLCVNPAHLEVISGVEHRRRFRERGCEVPSRVVTARVDGDMAGWIEAYARERDISRSDVFRRALECLRDGVSVAMVEPRAPSAPVASAPRATSVREDASAAYRQMMLERQVRLNERRPLSG